MEDRVLMLATTAAMIEQFNKTNIDVLNDMGVKVDVVGNFDKGNPISAERLKDFKDWVSARGGVCYNYSATRCPFDFINNFKAYKKVVEILRKNEYTFLHCHTPIGAVIGRLAGHITGTKVVYTAHGFHFYTGAPLLNWLLYYPVEKWLSRYTDTIITINKEDYKRAKEKFYAKNVEYIPGIGVDTDRFKRKLNGAKIREKLGIKPEDEVILSVGELNKNKNHEVVIKALGNLKRDNIYYIIAGKGKLDSYLKQVSRDAKMENRLKLVGFQSDIENYYDASDIFILPSIREGLNVSLMEAMSSGLPCVAGNIRGNVDLIDEGKGGYLFDVTSVEDVDKKLQMIEKHKREFGEYNKHKIGQFDIDTVRNKITKLYSKLTGRKVYLEEPVKEIYYGQTVS